VDLEGHEGGRKEAEDGGGDFGRSDGEGFKVVIEREEMVEDWWTRRFVGGEIIDRGAQEG
jgi:hypothetical protein